MNHYIDERAHRPDWSRSSNQSKAVARILLAVARRLEDARDWPRLANALKVNRRVWARMQAGGPGSPIPIPQGSVTVGATLAAAGTGGRPLNDHDIQAIINFNRRAATILPWADYPMVAARAERHLPALRQERSRELARIDAL